VSFHVKIAALQTVNTLSQFLSWNFLVLSLHIEKFAESVLKSLDNANSLKIFFELINSHNSHCYNFFFACICRKLTSILVIFGIRHSIDSLEKFAETLSDEVVAKYENLIVIPDYVESFN